MTCGGGAAADACGRRGSRGFARALVVGAGAWGTAFASLLAQAGIPTTVWARRADLAAELCAGRNERYLPGVSLPVGLDGTTDLLAAVDADLVVVAVPSQSAREVVAPLAGRLRPDAVVVSLMKGIELSTGMRMSEVLAEVLEVEPARVAVVSGPNLADEIIAGQVAATVVAAEDHDVAVRVAEACAATVLRPYVNTDVVGVELAGAVKNVIAVAAGVAAGRGAGDNAKAAIITRGLVEMSRLGLAMGAQQETFAGLAGMGDLVATCTSPLSRNQTFGRHLGEGMSVEEATAVSRGVAEGARSAPAVLALARRHEVDMPITAGVVAVVSGQASVEDVERALLARPRKTEGVHGQPLTAGGGQA